MSIISKVLIPLGLEWSRRCRCRCRRGGREASSLPAPEMRLSSLFRSRKKASSRKGQQLQPTSQTTSVSAVEIDLNTSDPTSPSPSSSTVVGSGEDKGRKGEEATGKRTRRRQSSAWRVYLIISSTIPKTYVGVTTNFSRRLKQHNGELKGGAKASRAGRPWLGACIVQGFKDRSEACAFETKWKSVTRRLPRKREKEEISASKLLLRHREKALVKVKDSLDCSHLEINWSMDPSY